MLHLSKNACTCSDPNDWQSQDEQNANDALRHTIYTERPGWPIYEAKLVRSVPAKWVAVVVGVAVAFLAAMVIGVVISTPSVRL